MLKTICHIVGCRPNFIKLAPVYRAAKGIFEQVILHTGQHYDFEMSGIFFKELEIPRPDYNLHCGGKSDHGEQTGAMLIWCEKVLAGQVKPDIVLVYGDTNSTLAGVLAAKKLKIPVGHVEAGIYADGENNPETINRKAIDAISDWLFKPQEIGDVMYDQFLWVQDKLEMAIDKNDPMYDYGLVTIHREENTDEERFKQIENGIQNIGRTVFWPRHPRTENPEPIGYLRMLSRIRDAQFVITDSGGVQKEAFWSKTPCLTIRKATEWVETIEQGWNKLVEPEDIPGAIKTGWTMHEHKNPYGDGKAAERIINILNHETNR